MFMESIELFKRGVLQQGQKCWCADVSEKMGVKKKITVTEAVNSKLRQYHFSEEGEVARVNEEVD